MKHKTYHNHNGVWQNQYGIKQKIHIIAGDDDQAIFRWAGADVDSFIAQTGKIMQLTQSYRIPQVVHDIASKHSK